MIIKYYRAKVNTYLEINVKLEYACFITYNRFIREVVRAVSHTPCKGGGKHVRVIHIDVDDNVFNYFSKRNKKITAPWPDGRLFLTKPTG